MYDCRCEHAPVLLLLPRLPALEYALTVTPVFPRIAVQHTIGKAQNSLHRRNSAQEQKFRRQRTEGADVKRAEWMRSVPLSDRDKRCVTRAWDRREEKAAKQFTDIRFCLGRGVSELRARVQTNAARVVRLRKAVLGNVFELLYIADEGVASGGVGGRGGR